VFRKFELKPDTFRAISGLFKIKETTQEKSFCVFPRWIWVYCRAVRHHTECRLFLDINLKRLEKFFFPQLLEKPRFPIPKAKLTGVDTAELGIRRSKFSPAEGALIRFVV
jgi:hypothetical protein